MADSSLIDGRLKTAAQLTLRARIFYDIWRFFDGAETRPGIIDTMRDYSEFFRFAPNAHFVSFVVQIAALMEKRNDTINLRGLAKELKGGGLISVKDASEVDALFERAAPLASKTKILRDKLFAHRNASLSYADVLENASVTPNELRDLTELALKIVNHLLMARDQDFYAFNPLPVAHAEAMLNALAEHARLELGQR
ncbi:MAG: hypothetical protein HQ514_15990 [Rhodospirillales bacterium]|nr:hypothetical protein [Rhodospirillales bacterium]